MAVSNLLLHGPKGEEALPVLRIALNNSQESVRGLAVDALYRKGKELSPDEVEKFEQTVACHPNDCALHLLLLGYYFLTFRSYDAARKARQGHIIWIIQHAPEIIRPGDSRIFLDPTSDGEVYQLAKKLWLKQVKANESNLTILGNASGFFTLHDKALSEELLKKAQSLEPKNPEWAERLGHLYELEMQCPKGESRPEAATKAFAELEKAFHLEGDELKRFWMMPNLAKTAFEAGELDKARTYAVDSLAKAALPDYSDGNNGDAKHHGNLVLGGLALKLGDVEIAKEHLLKAGQTSGSPVLCSFGPNMMLAKELLELGEGEVVIQYLKLCANFWQTIDHRAEKWIYAIEHGTVPDFGANLAY